MENVDTSRETALEAALALDQEIAEEDLPDLAQALTQEALLAVAEDITREATLLSVRETEEETGAEPLRLAKSAVAAADPAATAEDLAPELPATRKDPSLPEREHLRSLLSKEVLRFPRSSRKSMQRRPTLFEGLKSMKSPLEMCSV